MKRSPVRKFSQTDASARGREIVVHLRSIFFLTGFLLLCGKIPAQSTAGISVTGSEQIINGIADQGTVTVTVNGAAKTVAYGAFSSAASVASAIAAAFTKDCNSSAKAHANGSSIAFAARKGASLTSVNLTTQFDSSHFSRPSFATGSTSLGSTMALSCTPQTLYAGGQLTCNVQVSGATGSVSFTWMERASLMRGCLPVWQLQVQRRRLPQVRTP